MVKPASFSRRCKAAISNKVRWTEALRKEASIRRTKFLMTMSVSDYNSWMSNISKAARDFVYWRGKAFRSTWEVAFAKWLESNGVVYSYEPFRFKIDKRHSYTPDFLVAGKLFVEIKGWTSKVDFWKKVRRFLKKFPSIDFCVLDKKSMEALGCF